MLVSVEERFSLSEWIPFFVSFFEDLSLITLFREAFFEIYGTFVMNSSLSALLSSTRIVIWEKHNSYRVKYKSSS
jgi:hypothetical protein